MINAVVESDVPLDWIESRIAPVTESGCWLWLGSVTKKGYGRIRCNGRFALAHRALYRLHYGDIPAGQLICHKCDTPSCVRPEHLFAGTPQDNVDDMHAKGRNNRWCGKRRGARNPMAKLTAQQVSAIYRRRVIGKERVKVLADEFNTCAATISHIALGRMWTHLRLKEKFGGSNE